MSNANKANLRSQARLHQVFSLELPLPGAILRLEGDERHYLGRALRARPGERVKVADGLGHARIAVLRGFEGEAALLEIEAEAPEPVEAWRFHLGLCAPKGDALDLALEAAVQMGAESITLLRSKRTMVNFDGAALKTEKLERKLKEAARQCERSKVPFLLGPVNLGDFLDAQTDKLKLVASERGGAALADGAQLPVGTEILALIGPEGGFETAELALAEAGGWKAVTLGPRALKVPVAVTAIFAGLRSVQRSVDGEKSGPWGPHHP